MWQGRIPAEASVSQTTLEQLHILPTNGNGHSAKVGNNAYFSTCNFQFDSQKKNTKKQTNNNKKTMAYKEN